MSCSIFAGSTLGMTDFAGYWVMRYFTSALSAVAIEPIHRAYGYDTSPTEIMWETIKDKRRHLDGIHPNLK